MDDRAPPADLKQNPCSVPESLAAFARSQGFWDAAIQKAYAEACHGILHRLLVTLSREGTLRRAPESEALSFTLTCGPTALKVTYDHWLGFGRWGTTHTVEWLSRQVPLSPNLLQTPKQLLTALTPELERTFEPARLARFDAELESSLANLTLALLEAKRRENTEACHGDLRVWRRRFATQDEERRALEARVVIGHALHPGTKTRLGMSHAESWAFAPELSEGNSPLRFAAVERSHLQHSGLDAAPLLERLWPGFAASQRAELVRLGLQSERYDILPVHPWQAQHILPTRFAELCQKQSLVLLEGTQSMRPQLSLRTVEPSPKSAYHLKLSLAVQTTSAERTISAHSVHNGPLVGNLLQAVMRDPRVDILHERAAVGLHPDKLPGGEDDARHLAVIFRDNPTSVESRCSAEALWPAVAFTQPSPCSSERTLLADWLTTTQQPLPSFLQKFFECYVALLIEPTLTLVLRHGIAVEAHAQNTLIALSPEGLPQRLLLRDFGGIRIHLETLAQSGHTIALRAGSAVIARDLAEVHSKFSHCVLQTHIADVIAALHRDFPNMLANPWATVARILRQVLNNAEAPWLWTRETSAKALTTMRLVNRYNSYVYAPVDNPLAEYERASV